MWVPSTLQTLPASPPPPSGARPRPPIRGVRRAVTAALRVTLQLFFRTVKVEGDEHLPRDHAYIVALNHPNGLIDPGLVLVTAEAPISFLAKSTIFEMPVLGWLARTLRAIPVYRRQDAGADVAQNARTFEVAREVLMDGGAIALFPEGISHDARTLLPLKTGAARIALGAARRSDAPLRLSLVPAALLYSSKTRFRSDVVLRYGPPIAVPVGDKVLGRLLTPTGQVGDGGAPLGPDVPLRPIHRAPPPLEDQNAATAMFETGIKVIDLLEGRVQRGDERFEIVVNGLVSVLKDPMASGRITRRAAQFLASLNADLSKQVSELAPFMPDGYTLGTNGRVTKG